MKKLLSPRGYFSWTALSMFMQSEQKYIESYIHGNYVEISNPFIEFGKTFADVLDGKQESTDTLMDIVISSIVRYKETEKELRVEFETKYGVVTLLGKLDTFEDIPVLRFRDYKTGSVAWNQSKAQSSGQLLHYASIIWLIYKKIPDEVWLDWIPTEKDENGQVHFTGDQPRSFKVNFTLVDILSHLALVTKVAVKVDKIYRKELGL